jgi:hypothetical protein
MESQVQQKRLSKEPIARLSLSSHFVTVSMYYEDYAYIDK